ncbi:hypothetical protein NSS95_12215 [Weizmannia sp. FSL K6-3076]|uniref:hypothetical protein n=1 Tax=Weizmannia sp. FSL K6-3076 TaxID=2954542 RepID=UPI0030FB78EA
MQLKNPYERSGRGFSSDTGFLFPIEAAERALVSKLHEVGEVKNRMLAEAV